LAPLLFCKRRQQFYGSPFTREALSKRRAKNESISDLPIPLSAPFHLAPAPILRPSSHMLRGTILSLLDKAGAALYRRNTLKEHNGIRLVHLSFRHDKQHEFLRRTTQALDLIAEKDSRLYRRVRKYITTVVTRLQSHPEPPPPRPLPSPRSPPPYPITQTLGSRFTFHASSILISPVRPVAPY
jgi:hypothetical protein